jgi:hypothetical protein
MGMPVDPQVRAQAYDAPPPAGSGGLGWVVFAGCMMVMIGSFQAIAGLTALFNDEFFLTGKDGLVVSLDFTAWGWIHLILGLVIAFAGAAAMAGRTWGRAVGITLALLSAISNLFFLPAYPIWSALIIVIDVVVIHALAVHSEGV